MTRPVDLGGVVLDLLGETGGVRLPSLTREELHALGDQPVLAHAGDEQWWAALDEPAQALVAESAQRGLIARNLIVASDGAPGWSSPTPSSRSCGRVTSRPGSWSSANP